MTHLATYLHLGVPVPSKRTKQAYQASVPSKRTLHLLEIPHVHSLGTPVRQHLSSNHSFHGPFKSTSITLCRFALVLGSNSSSCTNRHNFRWFQPRTPLPDLRNSWEAAILMCTSLVLSHNKQLEYVTMVAACYKPGTSSRVVTQFTIAS